MELIVQNVKQTLMCAAESEDDESRAESLQQLLEDVCAEIEHEVHARFNSILSATHISYCSVRTHVHTHMHIYAKIQLQMHVQLT